MKTIQAVLVTIWGAVVVIPSFAQDAHIRTLAATATVQEMLTREADLGWRRRAEVVDRAAAAHILQSALDATR